MAESLVDRRSGSAARHRRDPEPRPVRLAHQAVLVVLGIIATKPLLDIPGAKVPQDTVDLGFVATCVGALLMVGAFAVVALRTRQVPRWLLLGIAALVLLGLESLLSLLLVPARSALLAIFAQPRPVLFGPYVPPVSGIVSEAGRLAVSFAPLVLLALVVLRRDWFSPYVLRLVIGGMVVGTLVQCAIAWLQVAGVVQYSYFFHFPGGQIGRASGAYYHPASLGRLLIFVVFLVLIAGDKLGVSRARQYAVLVPVVATAAVTLHRLTIICVALVLVALEGRRLRGLLRARRPREMLAGRTARWVLGGVLAAGVAVLAVFGHVIWSRTVFLVTQVGSLDVTSADFLRGRGAIWDTVIDTWKGAPVDVWLFGVGYEPWDLHNDVIRMVALWGLVGLGLALLMFTAMWRETWIRVSAEGRWAVSTAFAVFGLFALTQKPSAYPYFVWMFIFSLVTLVVLHPRPVPTVTGTAKVHPPVSVVDAT